MAGRRTCRARVYTEIGKTGGVCRGDFYLCGLGLQKALWTVVT